MLVVDAKIERQVYIEKVMPTLTDIGRTDLTYTCMHLGIQVLRSMQWHDAICKIKRLKHTLKSYPIGKKHLRTLPLKQRLHLIMLRFMFVPVCLLHSISKG